MREISPWLQEMDRKKTNNTALDYGEKKLWK
jgi:hypothetical protein